MVPVLAVSDIHFHAYKAHSSLVDGVNSRLLHQVDAWKQAVGAGTAEGCRLMLVAGDVFEVRGSIRPSVYNRVSGLIVDALAAGFDIGMISGNHDMEHLEAGESALDSWDYLKHRNGSGTRRCRVFKHPAVHRMAGYRVLGIPYMPDTEAFKKTFRKLSAAAGPDITVIHQGVDSFNTGNEPPSTGLTAEWLEDNNPGMVLCGHYHRPGLSKRGRVVNVGALVQHRFSDEGDDRGCWVLTGREAKFVRIESPRFVTFRDGRESADYRGAFVRICAKNEEQARRFRKKAEAAGALSVAVEIEKEFQTAHEKTVRMSSPREMLLQYLEIVNRYGDRKREIVDLFDRLCGR